MLLQDKAALWAHPIRTDIINGVRSNKATVWTSFYDLFENTFFDPDEKASAMRTLTTLKQLKSATAYTSDFQQLITTLRWTGDDQLKYHYYKGLKPELKDELAKVDAPSALDDYIRLVEKIDNRIWTRKQEKKEESSPPHRPNPTPRREYHAPAPTPMLNITTNDPIPMDIGAAVVRKGPISPEERQRRFREGLCLFCGTKGHRKSDCAELKRKGGVARAAMIRATETEEATTEGSGKGHDS